MERFDRLTNLQEFFYDDNALLEAIVKAMSNDDFKEIADYIDRCYDLNSEVE